MKGYFLPFPYPLPPGPNLGCVWDFSLIIYKLYLTEGPGNDIIFIRCKGGGVYLAVGKDDKRMVHGPWDSGKAHITCLPRKILCEIG